jgi:diguanylate cyclase (GGDEF)-like protein
MRWLAAILLIWLALPAQAQSERWSRLAETTFQHLAEPLPPVNAMAEDADGFLWFAGQSGIARWDGYRMRRYAVPPDSTALCLHTDAKGRLWVGTLVSGLMRYERENDALVPAAELPDRAAVSAIADDGAGGLWLGTTAGLWHFDPASGALRQAEGLPDPRVRALLLDHAGRLWAATNGGLALAQLQGPGFAKVDLAATPSSLFEDSQGRVWIGSDKQGIFLFAPGEAAPRPLREAAPPAGMALETASVSDIGETPAGDVWVATSERGIVVFDRNGRTRHLLHDTSRESALSHNAVRALYRDSAGQMWAATAIGIDRADPSQRAVLNIFGETVRTDTLSEAQVQSVLVADDGRIWAGLQKNGVDILDPGAAWVHSLRPDPAHPDSALPRARVSAMAHAGNGDIYLGTGAGLYRASPDGAHLTRIGVWPGHPELYVNAVLEIGHDLWVGGYRDGLWQMDAGRKAPLRFYGKDELTDQRIWALAAAGKGQVWVGTANGLNRIDPAKGVVEKITADANDPHALSAPFIYCLLVDAQGRLWVGTRGGGINVLEGRDAEGRPQFRRLGVAQGLPHGFVNKLLPDDTGRIWASTDDGLAAIDSKTFSVTALHKAEGAAFSVYWNNAGDRTRSGDLLFGAVGGLAVVRPDYLAGWNYRPPVVITDLWIGSQPVPPGRYLGGGAPLTLMADQRGLAVEFAALDLSSPERNRYAYRLEGFDRDWNAIDSSRRRAEYTNLPPGRYQLHLRGTNRDGQWSEPDLVLPVRVLPAWYQTLWFKILVVLVGASAVAAIVKRRTAALMRRQIELEKLVAERTDELVKAQAQIERIAFLDALTGLPNRRIFMEHFHKLVAQSQRRHAHFALLLLDLDRFKQINDSHGHDAGDAFLVHAAECFRKAVRESDVVARLGGDEFAILLSDSYDRAGVEAVCRRIVDSFAEPIWFKERQIATSTSIGIAYYPDHGDSQDRLFKSADLALYDAKGSGRNIWKWYEN